MQNGRIRTQAEGEVWENSTKADQGEKETTMVYI